jgi:hypothetical protein
MRHLFSKTCLAFLVLLMPLPLLAQDFQGKAYYFSKSTMELGSFGARMSEAQKKQIQENLKNRLEKTWMPCLELQTLGGKTLRLANNIKM